ncbi:hypothetical protein FE697_012435 [Mumia zhuanghuii]|uniref:Uncharacterized protein n=2 Tax=Mumia TaxID=1546255 RepID=A0ABW1QEB5_9ACTN|nr:MULTISPECIES: hypothetical protein [Mumia]KAA1422942.1 hypothetical protein FE697_012435 [Mumia zhuanghuii]
MGAVRTSDPITLAEAAAFAAAVVGPSWGLSVLMASLYVAGASFVELVWSVAFLPVSLLVVALAVPGVVVLVLVVQERWTRFEIALVCCVILGTAMWIAPTVVMSDHGAGFLMGMILVVLGLASGPLPLCFWVTTRMARTMRVATLDPAATSWLRDARAWALARYEALRSRSERLPQASDLAGPVVSDEHGEHR